MKRHLVYSIFSLLIVGLSLGPIVAQPPAPAVPAEEGVDVQTRGPVHEAFAQPYNPDPQPTPTVPRQPPPPVPEEPPEQKPPGDHVEWIPGYWSWDSDRNDFTWVSGFWRVPPPGRQWTPGSWTQVDGGWRWVPGYWAAADQQAVVYQEPPPVSLENGPATPAPDATSFYVPGCWVNRDDRYLWRPGFWQAFQPGWVWTNAQYAWTPRGYAFTDGYWDYGLEGRGLLFAPVDFEQPFWNTPGWRYRPGFAIGLDGLLGSLFARPRDGHYYFGDYYDARYRRAGFRPWYVQGRRIHDSLFDYYRWRHRGDGGWYAGMVNRYRGRRQGTLPRPPRTLAEQTKLLRNAKEGRDLSHLRMVTSVHQWRGDHTRLSTTTRIQRTNQRVDARPGRDSTRPRNLVGRSTVAAVRTRNLRPARRPAPVASAPRRESPGTRSHIAASARSPRRAQPANRASSVATAARFQAHQHVAASSRPATRPRRTAAPRSAPRAAQPRQARQAASPARARYAAPPRRAASPRPARQSHPRAAAAPRASRAPSRPTPRANSRSGSSRSGKHR